MSPNITFQIISTEKMLLFGQSIAQILLDQDYKGYILFYGPIGSGKTTFTRGFVNSLPKGDQAEITSPSFTICNNYPTKPEVIHCDLYRLPQIQPSEASELLDNNFGITIVEWAEHIPDIIRPNEHIAFYFYITECNYRKIQCFFYGAKEQQVFQKVKQQEQNILDILTMNT